MSRDGYSGFLAVRNFREKKVGFAMIY